VRSLVDYHDICLDFSSQYEKKGQFPYLSTFEKSVLILFCEADTRWRSHLPGMTMAFTRCHLWPPTRRIQGLHQLQARNVVGSGRRSSRRKYRPQLRK
jgi:hypothetical protein